MTKRAFDKIKEGLDEALVVAPYVAEIERLREENARLLEDIGQHKKVIGNLSRDWLHWKDRCEQFIDENARLREALKPFADRAKYAELMQNLREEWPVDISDLRAAAAAIRVEEKDG